MVRTPPDRKVVGAGPVGSGHGSYQLVSWWGGRCWCPPMAHAQWWQRRRGVAAWRGARNRGSLDVNSHNHRGLNSTLIGREIVPRRHVSRGNGGTKWKANEIETATYLVCGRESERGSVHSALTNIPKRPSGATSRRAIPPRTINSHPRELISRLESCVLADRAR